MFSVSFAWSDKTPVQEKERFILLCPYTKEKGKKKDHKEFVRGYEMFPFINLFGTASQKKTPTNYGF
jgi:hypothetical protein